MINEKHICLNLTLSTLEVGQKHLDSEMNVYMSFSFRVITFAPESG